jgi:hypothetical protein
MQFIEVPTTGRQSIPRYQTESKEFGGVSEFYTASNPRSRIGTIKNKSGIEFDKDS